MNRRTRRAARFLIAVLVVLTGGGAVGSVFGMLRNAVPGPQSGDVIMVTPNLLLLTPAAPVVSFQNTPLVSSQLEVPIGDPPAPAAVAGFPGEDGSSSVVAQPVAQQQVAIPSPRIANPPFGARPLQAGDIAIRQEADGILKSTSTRPARMSCDNDALLRVEGGAEGTFFVGVPASMGWDCSAALNQWRVVSPADQGLGLRYATAEATASQTVTLVDDNGASMIMVVTGAWRQ